MITKEEMQLLSRLEHIEAACDRREQLYLLANLTPTGHDDGFYAVYRQREKDEGHFIAHGHIYMIREYLDREYGKDPVGIVPGDRASL